LSETLNFRQASEKLFITQSTLSAGIKELEKALGVVLLERNKRSVRLTDIGAEVLDRALSIISQVDDLASITGPLKKPLSGNLKLGIIPTIAPFLLPIVIPALKSTYPQLKLYLREDFSARLLDQLKSGVLDFAVIALPYETGGLTVNRLFKDEFWWVAKKGQKLSKLKEISIKDVNLNELLLLEEGHCLRDHAIEACGSRPTNSVDQAFAATSLYTLLQMIDNGLGCTLLPELVIKSGALSGTELIARPFSSKPPFRDIALVKRETDGNTTDFELLSALIVSEKKQHSPTLGASRSKPQPR
jgi:LysR family hydrogen peroxide-inducible transcriptional activator